MKSRIQFLLLICISFHVFVLLGCRTTEENYSYENDDILEIAIVRSYSREFIERRMNGILKDSPASLKDEDVSIEVKDKMIRFVKAGTLADEMPFSSIDIGELKYKSIHTGGEHNSAVTWWRYVFVPFLDQKSKGQTSLCYYHHPSQSCGANRDHLRLLRRM